MFKQLIILLTVLVVPFMFVDAASAETNERHLIDLVDIQGLRDNQLIGYGLVVGLDGTGDRNQVKFTSQSVTNMLRQFGLQLPDNIDPKLRNVAAVSVHASIPPLAGPGQTIDVTVSSIGDAKSLRGGSLVMTPLRAIDGQIYAVAQGQPGCGRGQSRRPLWLQYHGQCANHRPDSGRGDYRGRNSF